MQTNKRTTEKGKVAEELATQYLQKKGYEILDRNSYQNHCEIDIVAFDRAKEQVVFVEVKSAKTDYFGKPEYQVSKKKIRFLYRAAELWLVKSTYRMYSCRFDVIGILMHPINKQFNHYENAFILGI